MEKQRERRLLQFAVALASFVPLSAGLEGAIEGPSMTKAGIAADARDLGSHFRYLSGLLLGLGIAFAAAIPTIERRSELLAALSGIVVVGGLSRLADLLAHGAPGTPHVLALGMELVVVPLLFAWQRKVARRFREPDEEPVPRATA